MSALPPKPGSISDVSDTLWEAALVKAGRTRVEGVANYSDVFQKIHIRESLIDHARCLILLGEVAEPVDPIEAALDAMWKQVSPFIKIYEQPYFKQHCREHFAGLTFPEVQP